MTEIVTIEQMDRLFLGLAVATLAAGGIVFAILRSRGAKVRDSARPAFLIAAIGPANLALWKVYNAVTDRLGLDTVKNLLVNLALFIGIGVAAGLAFGIAARRRGGAEAAEEGPEK